MRRLSAGFLALTVSASVARAQGGSPRWEFHTRLLATGSSVSSQPAGFTAYSAFPIEAGLRRALAGRFRLELSVRTESRELDKAQAPQAVRLGSIEVVPINLVAQYRFARRARVRPYLGTGLNATFAWEKTGTVDSMDVSPSFGVVAQAGIDVPLNDYLDFNADYRWNTWSTHIDARDGTRLATLKIDPAAFGVGLAVHF